MEYITYAKYKSYSGPLGNGPFITYGFEAKKIIDYYTFGRVKEMEVIPQEVEMCMFKLIEKLSNSQTNVKSESTDGYSVTYSTTDEYNKSLYDIVKTYLSDVVDDNGTPLLYRGV